MRDAVAAAMPGAQDVCRADVSVSEQRAPDEGVVADGKTVWSWRPWLASSRRRLAKPYRDLFSLNPAAMEARGIRLQGERAISRKTTAQGMNERQKCRQFNVIQLACSHSCRDPMLIWMRKNMGTYRCLWSPVEYSPARRCPTATAVFQQTQPVLFVGGRRA